MNFWGFCLSILLFVVCFGCYLEDIMEAMKKGIFGLFELFLNETVKLWLTVYIVCMFTDDCYAGFGDLLWLSKWVVIGSSVLMLTPFILYKIVFRDEEDMEELPEHMQARTSKEAFTDFVKKIWSKRKAIQEDIQKAWQDTSSESEDDKVDFSDW